MHITLKQAHIYYLLDRNLCNLIIAYCNLLLLTSWKKKKISYPIN